MSQEIKRTNWSRFIKRFNTQNLYRPVRLTFSPDMSDSSGLTDCSLFLGFSLTRAGRRISGLEIYAGVSDPERLGRPAVSVQGLARIDELTDDTGNRVGLTFASENGQAVRVTFDGEPLPQEALIEKLAYSLYERRGAHHGADLTDWYEAEQAVRRVTEPLLA